jgi:hypothetical protein
VDDLLAGKRVEMSWHERLSPIGKRAPKAKGVKPPETDVPF